MKKMGNFFPGKNKKATMTMKNLRQEPLQSRPANEYICNLKNLQHLENDILGVN